MAERHPFAGRKGAALRDHFALSLYADQLGACAMCGTTINPTLRGKRDNRAAVVDHIKPWKLEPERARDVTACWLICRQCHARCDGIEKRHWPDADRIAAEKRGHGGIGEDGWPIDSGLKRWGYSIPHGVQPSGIPVVLVCGPPASGKSTWAQDNATHDDHIIDFDVYRRRAGGSKWSTDPLVKRRAFNMRDADIRALANQSTGKCFLIVTAPSQDERNEWRRALGNVTVQLIRTPADECIRRIKADPARQEAADRQIEAVRNWWRHNKARGDGA